jgi:hypothetical protein
MHLDVRHRSNERNVVLRRSSRARLSGTVIFSLLLAALAVSPAQADTHGQLPPVEPAGGSALSTAPSTASTSTSLPTSIAGPWGALGSDGSGDGALNGNVNALAVHGNDLYAGGYITDVGGVAGANMIARWDGMSWSGVGPAYSLNGQVEAIAVSGSNVYVAGRFTDAGGNAKADYVARWNGRKWSALGSNAAGTNGALNAEVDALAISGSDVYIGGRFTNAGGHAKADYVARWNGSAWSSLGSNAAGTNGAIRPLPEKPLPGVFALAVSGTDLFVGGAFINVAGILEADNLARWSGSSWFAMGSGDVNTGSGAIDGAVDALAVSGTDLYAGGSFVNVGTLAGDYVAKWNGNAWSALGSGVPDDGAIWNGNVYALAVSGTDLYVGGEFYNAASISTADRIARWDGTNWNAMGSGGPDGGAIGGVVNALAVTDSGDDLYVGGGYWDTAGIATSDYVSLWGPEVVIRRPDARIRIGSGSYVGNNFYGTTGGDQSVTRSVAAGRTITFDISAQNDGNRSDRYTFKASGAAAPAYTVKYFRGTTNITAEVVAGTYETSPLAPGATYVITAKVTIKSTAAAGSKVTRLVTLTSVATGAKHDAVRFVAKRS